MPTIVLIPITPLPALSRTDFETFRPAVDLFFGQQLPTFSVDINGLAQQVYQLAQWASDYAAAAALSAGEAAASKDAAAASEQRAEQMAAIAETALASSATPSFVPGQLVAKDAVRYSPVSKETYRALTTGAHTIDPAYDSGEADSNWYLLGQAQAQNAALLWAFVFRRR